MALGLVILSREPFRWIGDGRIWIKWTESQDVNGW